MASLIGCVSKTSNDALKAENTILKSRITTLDYNFYKSNDSSIEFSYPATWVRQDTSQIVPFFVSANGVANVGITKEILPQTMTSDVYFAALNKQLQSQGCILCGTRQISAGSNSGIQAVYLNKQLLQVFVVVAKGNTAWSLIETAKSDEFIDWAQTFSEIDHSFKVQ